MDSIILGFTVVFPLLVYMIIGQVVYKSNWLSDITITEMNRLIFKLFLPSMIFLNSYNVDTDNVFTTDNLKLIILAISSVLLMVIAAELICKKFNVSAERKAIITQGTYRSNLALFGLSVSAAIYGEGNQGIIAMLMAVLIPVFNILAAIIFTSVNSSESKLSIKAVAKNIARNPLVIASLSGLLLSFMKFNIPVLPYSILTNLSRIATPLSFILLGAGLEFKHILKDKAPLFFTTLAKLVIMPILVLGLAVTLGIREVELVALLGCFASPVAVASYTMAKDEDVEPDLAGEIVAVTTVASIFTMFMFIATLSYFSLI